MEPDLLSKKDKKFFELAKKISKKSNHHRYKLGCVIVKNRTILKTGFNQMKSHPKAYNYWKQIHAEFHAIMGLLPSDLRGATAYVYRELRDGSPAMAKPCPHCQQMFCDCNIRKVYYTTDGGFDMMYI